GWTDSALSEVGRAQAEAVARALSTPALAAIYSSPLVRARDTAEAIARPHKLTVQVAAAFKEMGFGQWEGLRLAEARDRDQALYQSWLDTPHLVTPPGGETLGDVKARVLAGLETLRAEHDGGSICLVTHAIVARVLILEALGLPLSRTWSIHVSPTGISELEFRPDWTALHRMNTLVHLDAAPAGR
ncbi:MAG TPA: histidine phosphatase family protein, partial [Candidatus Limnocylindrales bacterium]|nr:histidine phosphatase family protein [Candidatus Limnocylindrales bacterium]